MNRFEGKVALITGAGNGIGKATAIRLAQEGAKVALHGRTLSKVEAVAEEIRAMGGEAKAYQVEVQNVDEAKKAIAETFQDFGQIDVLVNNAGVNNYKDPFDFTDEEYNEIMDINVKGTWNYCIYAGRYMKEAGGGSIVNISSNGAYVTSYMRAPYMASKGAVRLLTQALCLDFAQYNIRINDVAPGCTETGMTKPQQPRPGYGSRPIIAMLTPMRRYGKPEEQAAAVAFLASDEASYITGASIVVDGGFAAGAPLGLPIFPMGDPAFETPEWLKQFDYIKEMEAK